LYINTLMNENIDNIDLEHYSKEGEFLEEYYKLNDFLACKETNQLLEYEHYNNYENQIEPQIIELYEFFKKNLDNNGIRIFNKDNGGSAIGELVSLIYNNLNKNYDLTLFYQNPELAQSLLEMDKK